MIWWWSFFLSTTVVLSKAGMGMKLHVSFCSDTVVGPRTFPWWPSDAKSVWGFFIVHQTCFSLDRMRNFTRLLFWHIFSLCFTYHWRIDTACFLFFFSCCSFVQFDSTCSCMKLLPARWANSQSHSLQVLTAAVLQLFLEVRHALGEPGIGLPRQIWAATWHTVCKEHIELMRHIVWQWANYYIVPH